MPRMAPHPSNFEPQQFPWRGPTDPRAEATFVLCAGILLAWLNLPDDDPVAIFRAGAMVVGTALLLSLLIEARSGPRSLLRTDVLMLLALYGLTFVEFLFPQPEMAVDLTPEAAQDGTAVVLLGFVGLAIGRHFALRGTSQPTFALVHLRPNTLGFIFFGAFFVGYFHMLWAVNFDPVTLVSEMLLPRFSQPWGRGRLGGWGDLVYELRLLIYLLPPLAGIVLARHREYKGSLVLAISLGLAMVLFESFANGTRNVFAVHVITLTVAYLMFVPKLTFGRFMGVSVVAGLLLLGATHYMLEFRKIGLGHYLAQGIPAVADEVGTLMVDHNLLTISALTQVFPERYEYLGFEIPLHAAMHPIPRAIWSGKPEGLSLSIEEAVGVGDRVTLAATFVGEAYISGGYIAILGASLILGALGAHWNRLGQRTSSNFDIVLYASGFFAAALGMRSILWVSVAVLPTLALWIYGRWFLKDRTVTRSRRTAQIDAQR